MALDADPFGALLYGVDLRLTDDGDLSVTNGGDLALAIGTVAAAQAVVSRLHTPPGSLPLHADYGSELLTKVLGSKAQDAQLVLSHTLTFSRRIAEQDRRFLGLSGIEVISDGTATKISATITLAGGERLRAADLGAPRTDELAMDATSLTELASLGDLSDVGLTDVVAGIPSDDPDYGDVVDFSAILDDLGADDEPAENEGPA